MYVVRHALGSEDTRPGNVYIGTYGMSARGCPEGPGSLVPGGQSGGR